MIFNRLLTESIFELKVGEKFDFFSIHFMKNIRKIYRFKNRCRQVLVQCLFSLELHKLYIKHIGYFTYMTASS